MQAMIERMLSVCDCGERREKRGADERVLLGYDVYCPFERKEEMDEWCVFECVLCFG